jgi:hypothetical protein
LLRLAVEAVGVIVAAFLGLIAVGHIAQTDWIATFLYNGDSLALPLLQQSIERGEPLDFVFSSQNYLFPEAPLYLLGAIFTSSARVAMFINGCINVVALYLLLRAVAHNLAHRSRHQLVEVLIAFVGTLLLVVFVLLEPTAAVNEKGIATLFLFSTYYDGVILSGLAVIALTLWLTRAFGPLSWDRRRVRIYAVLIIVITALTAFSDPLYLLQVVAPLAVAVLLLVLLKRLTWRQFVTLAVPNAIGLVIALILRLVFLRSFESSVGAYLFLGHVAAPIHLLLETARDQLSTPEGVVTAILLGGTLLLSLGLFVFALGARSRPERAALISTSEVFIASFASLSLVSLIAGMIITGSTTTRYLEPIYVFPLLTVVSVGIYALRRLLIGVQRADLRRSLSRFALGVACIASALIVVVGAVNVAPVAAAASGTGYTGAVCFDRFIGNSHANGVGSYWTVRDLELYGTGKGEVLQADNANGPIEVFAWINNLGSYIGKDFSYVVTDSSGQLTPSSLKSLGRPRKVVNCGAYTIFDYRGTPGAALLTAAIHKSLSLELARSAPR